MCNLLFDDAIYSGVLGQSHGLSPLGARNLYASRLGCGPVRENQALADALRRHFRQRAAQFMETKPTRPTFDQTIDKATWLRNWK
jgi:hypothetical protein